MPLGRGLGSLIPIKEQEKKVEVSSYLADTNISEVSVDEIEANPHQPRQEFANIADLTESIRRYGVLQPVLLTQKGDGYELVAGERRFRAAKAAGLKTIPAVVRNASELEKLELALIENIQREDLNPIERAEGYARLVEEFGLIQEEAAKRVGVSRPTFANAIRLLTLPEEIKFALVLGKISESHAKAILGLKTREEQLRHFKQLIFGKKVSVRELEAKVYGRKNSQLIAWEDELREATGTKVEIKNRKNKGTISLHYFSPEELSSLVRRLLSLK